MRGGMDKKARVQEVADLACLKIEESELDQYQGPFDKILQYFAALEGVKTEGIEPMVTPHDKKVSLREDIVARDVEVEELLENAPEIKDSLFKVPPVV